MNDREFRAMLQASRERNKHNSYAYTNNPTSYEAPTFSKSERKNIEAVIRSITPRGRYMSVRKEKENTLKTFLMSFDSYEQLPSRIGDIIIGLAVMPEEIIITEKFSIYYEILTRLAQAQ